MSAENRGAVRQRVFLKGRISFNNGASSMDCLVRDMSAAGARIAISESSSLPEAFDLYIPQKDRTYRATLRWRREDGIGVTFGEATLAPEPPPAGDASLTILLRRVAELEAENAALRRLLSSVPRPGDAAAA